MCPPMRDPWADLRSRLDEFAQARAWKQYHSPKNLAMALAGEVGELVAEFQWLTEDESQFDSLTEEHRQRVSEEIADIVIYLTYLCSALQIDPIEAARSKFAKNEQRFPGLS
jgi:dCTP diphosphatase